MYAGIKEIDRGIMCIFFCYTWTLTVFESWKRPAGSPEAKMCLSWPSLVLCVSNKSGWILDTPLWSLCKHESDEISVEVRFSLRYNLWDGEAGLLLAFFWCTGERTLCFCVTFTVAASKSCQSFSSVGSVTFSSAELAISPSCNTSSQLLSLPLSVSSSKMISCLPAKETNKFETLNFCIHFMHILRW